MLVATTAACKKATPLEGHWRGLRVEGQAQALRPVYQQVTQYASELDIVAQGNRLTVEMPGKSRTAEFKVTEVAKAADQSTRVTISVAGGDQEVFTFPSDTTMRWLVAEGTYIVFQRQRQ